MKQLVEVCEPGDCVTFILSLNGRAYGAHWVVYEGCLPSDQHEKGGVHRLLFFSETDPSSIGLGGPTARMRAELVCDGYFYPLRYRVMTDHSVNVAAFNDEATLFLPDGTSKKVPLEPFYCLLGENVGQLDLLLRLAADELGTAYSVSFFSLGGVTTAKYSLTRIGPGDDKFPGSSCYRSSFLETLYIAADGSLLRMEIPQECIVIERGERPLPEWRSENILRPAVTYTPPEGARFTIEDIVCDGRDCSIGATLTIPKRAPPHPVALFIAGSGAKDRHGIAGQVDIGSHEIVDFLSNNSWLGARSDSRGTGSTVLGENFLDYGFQEVLEDTRTVLDTVLHRPDVDPQRVVLIGHSQGALAALLLSLEYPRIYAVVLLAMAGRRLREVLADQICIQARWLNLDENQVRYQLQELNEFLEWAQHGEDWEPEKIPPRFYVYKRQRKWYADHLSLNPLDLIRRVHCPVLICQGAKDFQVSLEKDAQRLFEAAQGAGATVEMAVLEDLDHFFKPVSGEAHVSHYYDSSRRVSEELKKTVLNFLNRAR